MQQRINEDFAGKEAQLVEAVSRICRIDSTIGEAQPGMPFGPGPAAALEEMLKLSAELGLPGETTDMMIATTQAAVAAGTDGVKFHLLHVLKGTDLAKEYAAGNFDCLSLEEYGKILKQCIAVLPEDMVVHRITGDGAKKDLIAPLWSADKKRVLNYLHKVLDMK